MADDLARRPGRPLDPRGGLRPQRQRRLPKPRHPDPRNQARRPVGHPPGRRLDLSDGPRRDRIGRPAVPRPARPEDDGEGPAIPLRQRGLRATARVRRLVEVADLDRARVEGRAGQRLLGRARVGRSDQVDRQSRPRPRVDRPDQGAGQIPPGRRRPALGDALPPAEISAWHEVAVDRLGLPARILRRRHGGASPGVARHLHLAPRGFPPVLPDARLRRADGRDDARRRLARRR